MAISGFVLAAPVAAPAAKEEEEETSPADVVVSYSTGPVSMG